jgi:hypothetical protein
LNSTLTSFSSRIGNQGEHCSTTRLKEASTPFHAAQASLLLPSKFLVQINTPPPDGMLA